MVHTVSPLFFLPSDLVVFLLPLLKLFEVFVTILKVPMQRKIQLCFYDPLSTS